MPALWTPAEITTALWLDAADTSTITESGGAVSQWADKSGNDNHATIGASPTTGANTLNGHNVLTFDGVNDYLSVGTVLGKPANFSVIAVARPSALSSSQCIAGAMSSAGASGTAWGRLLSFASAGTQKISSDFGTGPSDYKLVYSSEDVLSIDTPVILCTTYASGDSVTNLYANGSDLTENIYFGSATACSGTAYAYAIGRPGEFNGQYFSGDIAEVLVFQSELSATDRQKIEGYLAHKWDLESNLPVDHPYKTNAPLGSALDPVLPGIGASFSARQSNTLFGSLGSVSADFSASAHATFLSQLSPISAFFDAEVPVDKFLDADLPTLTGSFTAHTISQIVGRLPGLTAAMTADVTVKAYIADTLAMRTSMPATPSFYLATSLDLQDSSSAIQETQAKLEDLLDFSTNLAFVAKAFQTDRLDLADTLRGDFLRLALMAEHLVMSESFNATIETTARQQDSLALDDSLAFVIRVLMADGIDFDTTVIPDPHLFCRMAERIAFSDSFATLSTLKAAMVDSVEFAEAVRFVARVVLGDTLDLDTQATDADVLRIGQMADKIALLTRNAAVLETLVSLADALVFLTSIDPSYKFSMADTLAVSTEVTAQLIALCAQTDVLELVDQLAGSIAFFAKSADAINFIDYQNPTLIALLRQKDVLAFIGRLPLGDEDYQAWVLNSDSLGVTEYTNFQFNSLANWKGRTFGLTDVALYELTGDDDDGDPINALLRTGDLTFGTSNHKTVSRAYLYLTSSDDVYFKTISTWRGRRDETWYRVNYREDADDGQTRRVRLGKGLRGTTWAFELQNIDGGDFDVRGAEVLPVLLSRKV